MTLTALATTTRPGEPLETTVRSSATGAETGAATPAAHHLPSSRPAPPAPPEPIERREALATNLARCAVEAIAGARDLDQLARWVTPRVYDALFVRVQHAERARRARRRQVRRTSVTVRAVSAQHGDGASEITVVIDVGMRVRAVCVRVEPVESRWRATLVAVL